MLYCFCLFCCCAKIIVFICIQLYVGSIVMPEKMIKNPKVDFVSDLTLYFNVKRIIWLKGYHNGNHIEPSEQRLQKITIAKNWPRARFEPAGFGFPVHCKGRRFESCARSIIRNAYFLQPMFWWLYLVAIVVTLKARSHFCVAELSAAKIAIKL